MKLVAVALLFLTLSGCGTGSDEITISCNNAGSGNQVCGATGGAAVDLPPARETPVPTPRR